VGDGSAIQPFGADALPMVLASTMMPEAYEEGVPWRGW